MLCIVKGFVNHAGLLEGLLREVFLVADVVNARIGIAVPAVV